MASPTQRTLEYLRKQGWTPDVCERWLPAMATPAKGQQPALFRLVRRKDLWGFGDVIAIAPDEQPLIVQCTSGSNTAARVSKMLDDPDVSPRVELAMRSGIRVEVWGWRKIKLKPGGKAVRWAPKIQPLSLALFEHKRRAPEDRDP